MWNGQSRPNHGATPSKTRAEQEVNTAGIMPSRARAEAVYELPPSGRRHAAEATPSRLRREMATSRPPLQPLSTVEAVDSMLETPSNQRRAFLGWPQDSVSTMGSASPAAPPDGARLRRQDPKRASGDPPLGGGGERLGRGTVRRRRIAGAASADEQRLEDGRQGERLAGGAADDPARRRERPDPLARGGAAAAASASSAARKCSAVAGPPPPDGLADQRAGVPWRDPPEHRAVGSGGPGAGQRRRRGRSREPARWRRQEEAEGVVRQHARAGRGADEARRRGPYEGGGPIGGGEGHPHRAWRSAGGAFDRDARRRTRPGEEAPEQDRVRPSRRRPSRGEGEEAVPEEGIEEGAVVAAPPGYDSGWSAQVSVSRRSGQSRRRLCGPLVRHPGLQRRLGRLRHAGERGLGRRRVGPEGALREARGDAGRLPRGPRAAAGEEGGGREDRGRRARAEQQEELEKQAGAKSQQTPSRARAKSAVKKTPAARGGATTPSRARPTTAVKSKRADGTPGSAERGNRPWNYGNAPSPAAAADYGRTPSAGRRGTTPAGRRHGGRDPWRGLRDDDDGPKVAAECGEDVEREGRDAEEGDVSDDEDSPGGNDSDVEDICR
ncbi:hypothetical protein THAOC_06216, partial [Thalassiosira oceanica]